MNETLLYRQTLESMSSAQIEALISISEGQPSIAVDPFVHYALADRGLIYTWGQQLDIARAHDMIWSEAETLTDYGRAFVAWYRQPHDVPQQRRLL